jgi:hypothetical protein
MVRRATGRGLQHRASHQTPRSGMKITIKQYLLYSSVFAIFTEAFLIRYIIDWKLLYLIILVNFVIMMRIQPLKYNVYFGLLLAFFFVHGVLTYSIIGIPPNFMLSQILGIAVVGSYYYNVLPYFTKSDVVRVYTQMSFYIAIIGYIQHFFFIDPGDPRLESILTEPAHYVIVVLPACYYFFKERRYFKFAVIFGTLIMSNSSLGYIGCGLMFVIPNLTMRRIGYLVSLVPLVFAIFVYVYNEFEFFRMRVDDTYNSLNVINTGKFEEDTNLSSYVMIANMFIAKENVADHPFGSGIGSHHYMHTQRYLFEMRPPDYLRAQGRHTDNSFDANSLFTRIVSEFGLFGFIFVVFCLYRASDCFKSKSQHLAQGIFIYFLLKLFRDGHYFPPELFFFIWIFVFSLKGWFASEPMPAAQIEAGPKS